MSDRRSDLDRLYRLLHDLETRYGGTRTLAGCNGRMDWPQRGVYFFFEPGETREDGETPRVVRVGTHALRPSKSTLWGRLSQHRGHTSGRHAGGGNHRGSIFRLHVGTALLATGDWPEDVRASWPDRRNAPAEVREREADLERAVSKHIGAMPFVWLDVDDEPSAGSARGVIELNSIVLLSNAKATVIDPPSTSWLGRHADRETISVSGLWNVNHVRDGYTPASLDVFEDFVHRM